jgi:hypothetical protein
VITHIFTGIKISCNDKFFKKKNFLTLKVFENRVLRRIYGSIRVEITGNMRKCIMRSFIIITLLQVLSGYSNQGG